MKALGFAIRNEVFHTSKIASDERAKGFIISDTRRPRWKDPKPAALSSVKALDFVPDDPGHDRGVVEHDGAGLRCRRSHGHGVQAISHDRRRCRA